MHDNASAHRIGWIGVGNMGRPLVTHLLAAGCDVAVYNRTRSKAEALTELGATVVDAPIALADRDIVFTVVSGPDDFASVVLGPGGLLDDSSSSPAHIVDCSTISSEASERVRAAGAARGTVLLAAPVSGNGAAVARGAALFAVSGPRDAADVVRPYLEMMGRGAHYVGEGDRARVVKIAHNLLLGAIIQSLVETTLLAQAHGIPRRPYLDFINDSALGSAFSAYKSPALTDLDWTPTFTSTLLRKDLELGLDAAAGPGVALPVSEVVRAQVQAAIDAGHGGDDFASMLAVQARAAALQLVSEADDSETDDADPVAVEAGR
jgi:3-hydroxyisobutyrate dehydrogenase-like beta-hydroxyacid dehydrogenase